MLIFFKMNYHNG